jgi:DNA-binding NarL/FixJ family response regulator
VSIRILLADDHKIVREGLRALLTKKPDFEVVAEAENGRMALQVAREVMPDVIIMDLTMPDLNGIEATHQLIAALPDVKVIALSMHSDNRLVVGMLDAGAVGYLLKDCAFEELENAIHNVVANQIYLSPKITRDFIEYHVRNSLLAQSSAFSVLTTRERQILQLLAEGKNTKQMAASFKVSIKTVEAHRKHIMKKLNIHSVSGLTKYAIREGLTGLEDL